MNKVHRTGLDLEKLFAVKFKKSTPGYQIQQLQGTQSEQVYAEERKEKGAISPRFRPMIKSILRKLAVLVYRVCRPFVRPVAHRIRAFLLDGFRTHYFEDHSYHLAVLEKKVTSLSAGLDGLKTDLAKISQESPRHVLEVLQELQFTKDFLERNIRQILARRLDNFSEGLVRYTGQVLERLEDLSAQVRSVEFLSNAAVRRFAVNCGGGDVLVRTEAGYIMCQGSKDPAILTALIDTGDLERGTRLLIQRLLKPGDIFIDVGANIGTHTIAAARAMNGKGKIIAFEPFPDSARLLGISALVNGFSDIIEIHQTAISTAVGTRPLYLGRVSGHHSLFQHVVDQSGGLGNIEVQLESIDQVTEGRGPISLIKIDVEGAELEVLATAERTIQDNPDIALIVEFGPSHLQAAGHLPTEWMAAFTKLGLDWRVINAETGGLETSSLDELNGVYSVNLLFSRSDSLRFCV